MQKHITNITPQTSESIGSIKKKCSAGEEATSSYKTARKEKQSGKARARHWKSQEAQQLQLVHPHHLLCLSQMITEDMIWSS